MVIRGMSRSLAVWISPGAPLISNQPFVEGPLDHDQAEDPNIRSPAGGS